MARNVALAHALDLSGPLLTRFLAGFTDANRTTQAPNLPNHAAWTLGHCAIAMHRVANRLSETDGFPDEDFAPGASFDPEHRGEATGRFSASSVIFGSTPVDRPSLYPKLARAVEVFDAARTRLVQLTLDTPDDELERAFAWHTTTITAADLVARITFHNGVHAGQLTDLRRALRFAPIIL